MNRKGLAMASLEASQSRAGWSIPAWCASAGISRGLFYTLEGERAPRSVKLGKRRIVLEPPSDYLARIAGQSLAEGVAA